MIRIRPLAAALLAAIALAAPVHAQEAQGTQQPQARQEDPVKVKHGDWEVRCVGGDQPCYLSQVMNGPEGGPIMNVVIRNLPDNPEAEAVIVFRAPLGAVLPRGVEMRIDGGEMIRAPFLYCLPNGCFAELAMTDEGLGRMRSGAAAAINIYSVQTPNDAVPVRMSLMGFTRAYGELN